MLCLGACQANCWNCCLIWNLLSNSILCLRVRAKSEKSSFETERELRKAIWLCVCFLSSLTAFESEDMSDMEMEAFGSHPRSDWLVFDIDPCVCLASKYCLLFVLTAPPAERGKPARSSFFEKERERIPRNSEPSDKGPAVQVESANSSPLPPSLLPAGWILFCLLILFFSWCCPSSWVVLKAGNAKFNPSITQPHVFALFGHAQRSFVGWREFLSDFNSWIA